MQELLPVLGDAKKLFLSEPTLLEVDAPCVVIGDIHGQVCHFSLLIKIIVNNPFLFQYSEDC